MSSPPPTQTDQQSLTDISEEDAVTRTETPESSNDTGTVDETPTDSQASLMEMSYEGHTLSQPPEARVTASIDEADDLFTSDVGDVLWVDGTEYVVVDRAEALIAPNPLVVISESGEQHELIGGVIPQSPTEAAGVSWRSTVSEKERSELSKSDLLCGFDRVYRLESESLEHVHSWTPDVDSRAVCPACGKERSGSPLRIERQGSKAVEIRRCTNTDCKHTFRFVRDFPEPDTATIVTYDYRADAFGTESVTGVFRCEEQDDFKFPLDTHKGRDDGFFTASEIAAFVNRKMVGEVIAAQVDVGEFDVSEVLDLVDLEMVSDLEDPDEIDDLEAYLQQEIEPESPSFMEFLSRIDSSELLEAVDHAQLESVLGETKDPLAVDVHTLLDGSVDDEILACIDEDMIRSIVSDTLDSDIVHLQQLYEALCEADNPFSSPALKTLLDEYSDREPFGVVDVSTNRCGELVVEWKDDGGYNKMMRVTYTRIEHEQPEYGRALWTMERRGTDFGLIMP